MSDPADTVCAMYGDTDFYQDKHQWTIAQWGGYWILALVATCVLMAAIHVTILTFADARSDLNYDRDPTANFGLSAGAGLVAALAGWWSWTRFAALFSHAGPGASFAIWFGVTALTALAVGYCMGATGSKRSWVVSTAAVAALGFAALVTDWLNKISSALGISIGAVVLLGVVAVVAIISN